MRETCCASKPHLDETQIRQVLYFAVAPIIKIPKRARRLGDTVALRSWDLAGVMEKVTRIIIRRWWTQILDDTNISF